MYFVFTGNGSQWSQMGLSLLRNHPTFRTSIFASAVVAKDLGVDLLAEFEDEAGFKDPARSALGLCSLQVHDSTLIASLWFRCAQKLIAARHF